jgi:hypothetical protein
MNNLTLSLCIAHVIEKNDISPSFVVKQANKSNVDTIGLDQKSTQRRSSLVQENQFLSQMVF